MPFGAVRDVRETVRRQEEEPATDGALTLARTRMIEPEVPLARIEAFAATVREFGEFT